mgnify:CR=1 FL=1
MEKSQSSAMEWNNAAESAGSMPWGIWAVTCDTVSTESPRRYSTSSVAELFLSASVAFREEQPTAATHISDVMLAADRTRGIFLLVQSILPIDVPMLRLWATPFVNAKLIINNDLWSI